MRISKKIIQTKFELLCRLIGKEVGYKEGQWSLDNTPHYGGWIIVEGCKDGGEHHPLIRRRLKAQGFVDAMDFIIEYKLNVGGAND